MAARVRAWLFVGVSAACTVQIDYGDTFYACGPEEQCPGGSSCRLGRCVAELPALDGAATIDGTMPATDGTMGGDGASSSDAGLFDAAPLPRCGDSIIRPGVETCDDGNTADGDTCPSTCRDCAGVFHAGHCYTRVDTATSWSAARAGCEAQGGHLATLTDAAEDAAVSALQDQSDPWFGFEDLAVEGTWRWITGEPVTYTFWNTGEPNDAGGLEDCGQYYVGITWNDNNCGASYTSLCEDDGFAIRPGDAHAYRVIWQPLEWTAAMSACAALGGHVATLDSADEQAFVQPLATVEMRLGMTDLVTEGTFVWTTGEPMTYTNWVPGEPNDSPNNSDCASILPGGAWADSKCTAAIPTICEVD
jgi:cysteine-rich repeat protein